MGGVVTATNLFVGPWPVSTGSGGGSSFTGGAVSGSTQFTSTAASTSTTTGAVTVAGGVGVGGNINVGGSLKIGAGIPNCLSQIGIFKSSVVGVPVLAMWNTQSNGYSSISYFDTSGAEQSAAGYAQSGSTYYAGLAYFYSNNGLALSGSGLGTNGNKDILINSSGVVSIARTTQSTSTNTGALVVAGGVGVGGAVYIANTSYVAGAQIITTATIGLYASSSSNTSSYANTATSIAITTSSGTGTYYLTMISTLSGNLSVISDAGANLTYNPGLGQMTIASTATSTGTNTGALVVTGGAGIGGCLNVGGRIVGGGVRTTTTSTPPTNPTTGDIWYDSATDDIYRYTVDGNGTGAWLDITGPTIGNTVQTYGYADANQVVHVNNRVLTTSTTIGSNIGAMTVGPVTLNAGVTVSLSTGSRWVIL